MKIPRPNRLATATAVSAALVAGGLLGVDGGSARAAASVTSVVDNGGTVLSHRTAANTGSLGVTFGFSQQTLAGGPYVIQGSEVHNFPLYEANTASRAEFWDNYVEELVTAGVDFVAVDTRGYVPGTTVPNGDGDPRELSELVAAINRAGVGGTLKIAAFDDTPSSMTEKKNEVKYHFGGLDPVFDMADRTGAGDGGYQYLWDNDLKSFFQAVPDGLLYKVGGQPLVYLWSDDAFAFKNQGNGNSAALLSYVRSHAQATFGENPYFIADNSWLKNDPAVASVINGVDGWFGVPSPSSTSVAFNGSSYGASAPSFFTGTGATARVMDPAHGNTLVKGMEATVDAGDKVTLVEGTTDWPEGAALWRTEAAPYATTQRDYPGQDLNILRRYSHSPFPATLNVQAESADSVHDTTAGNQWGIYRADGLDVQTTIDTGGGWNVGNIAAGEWEQWQEVPMQGTENLKVRVASPLTGSQLRFVVDGVPGPTVNVPNTGGWQNWQTVDAGSFQFKPGTYHTVQIQYVTGGINVNWWQAVTSTASTGRSR